MNTRKRDTHDEQPNKIAKTTQQSEVTDSKRIEKVEEQLNDVLSILKGIKTDMDKVSHSITNKEGAILNITDETRMVVVNSVVNKLDNMQDCVELNNSDIKSFISEELDRKFESYKTNSIFNQGCASYNSDKMNLSDNENSSNILNEGQYQKPVEGKYRFFCVHVSKFSL